MAPFTCETCRRTEMTRWARLREDLLDILGLDRGPRHSAALRGLASFTAVAMGAPFTPYDRHRREYERTGDPAELTRMLRHVG